VIAINRENGEIMWNTVVFRQEPGRQHPRNSRATPTPVTDGERVYAVFSNGHFAALDFEGNVVWTNTELVFSSQHGFGASPLLYGDLLIAPVNPSVGQTGFLELWDQSFLWALDKYTGEERWRGTRTMSKIGHSTPVVIQVDGKDQILSMAGGVIQGFEPETGELIWTVRHFGEPAVPIPAIGDGMIFTSTRLSEPILGIRTDGRGDVTDTHVVWRQPRNSPMISSFLYVNSVLYSAHENGTFAAFDPATGEVLWEYRLQGGSPDSSPIYVDGNIYVTTFEGITTVLRPNTNPRIAAEVVSVNDIGATVQATVGVAGKQLFLRTENELWAIGE
jgi:outer membrane protein assembly factor BamB